MMFTLNEQSRKSVEETTGIPFDMIMDMDFDDIDKKIEQRIRKKLTFMKASDSAILPRGQVYYETNRMIDMADIDKELQDMLIAR